MPIPYLGLMMMSMALGGAMGFSMKILYDIVVKRSWPIQTPIAMQRGNSVVWKLDDRAKTILRKDGTEGMRIRKIKRDIAIPKYSFLSTNTSGKPVYPVYESARGQYFPIRLMSPPRLEVVEDKSSKNWAINELGRLSKVYSAKESALLKYAPYIMNATFAAMIIFFVIYFGGKMELVANSLGGAASSLTNAINMLNTPPA